MSERPPGDDRRALGIARLEAVLAEHSLPLSLIESIAIAAELRRHRGCTTHAANALGVGRTTLYRRRRAAASASPTTPRTDD